MLPIYNIELIYQRENAELSSDVSELYTVIHLVNDWLTSQQLECAPCYRDRSKSEEVREMGNQLFKGYGFISLIKNIFRKEKSPSQEEVMQYLEFSKNHDKEFRMADFVSSKEFCSAAIKVLDSSVVPRLISKGKPSKNWHSIVMCSKLSSYNLSIDLYRFVDETMGVYVSMRSFEAHDKKELQKQGKMHMTSLKSISEKFHYI